MLKKGAVAKLYTGDMREREIFKNFNLSKKAGEIHYLCSEKATCVGNGNEIKGNNMEEQEKTNENRITYPAN